MKVSSQQVRPPSRSSTLSRPSLFLVLGAVFGLLALTTSAEAAATAVPLGTARQFAVLAGAGITNTGTTTITGDIGTYPITSITGSQTIVLNGANHAGDAVTQQAKQDLITAYDNAAGQGPTNPIAGGNLGGRTLTSGVYTSASSLGLTGTLTLNGEGNPNAVFIFQAGSTLTTASASRINLINGAQSCKVFWQIGSSATLGTFSQFRGTILALSSITATTGVTVRGRLLARNGSVTLDANTITRPTCAAAGGTPTPTPTPGGSPSPQATPTPTTTPTPSVLNPHPQPSPPRNSFGLTG
jgi:hypothetical protein